MSWLSDRVQDTYDYLNPEPLHPAPDEPRMRGWRSTAPATIGGVADPGSADFMLPPTAPSWQAEHRYAPLGREISQGDAYWMSGGRLPPPPTEADAYRMGGLAAMDQYGKAAMPVYGKRNPSWSRLDDEALGPDVGARTGELLKDWVLPHSGGDVAINAGMGGMAARMIPQARIPLIAAGALEKMLDPAEAGTRYKRRHQRRGD